MLETQTREDSYKRKNIRDSSLKVKGENTYIKILALSYAASMSSLMGQGDFSYPLFHTLAKNCFLLRLHIRKRLNGDDETFQIFNIIF